MISVLNIPVLHFGKKLKCFVYLCSTRCSSYKSGKGGKASSSDYRTEKDSFGELKIPKNKLYGIQTARAMKHFEISGGADKVPKVFIKAYGISKKASAYANTEVSDLDPSIRDAIAKACDEVISGALIDEHFPVTNWQTTTQANMNANEVIANRAIQIMGGTVGSKTPVHPNDHVNKSQSTNDTFPTASHISIAIELVKNLKPALEIIIATLDKKIKEFEGIVKTGRTHTMDATPIKLTQEFSAYKQQMKNGISRIDATLPRIFEIALGGTTVGTGVNTCSGYAEAAARKVAEFTCLPFVSAPNLVEAVANNDAVVEVSGCLNAIAVSLFKFSNDIRFMSSGPRCGWYELSLPENEQGSSIMPGKVNPTQIDVLSNVCAQVMGNHVAITIGGMSGHLELNVLNPVMTFNCIKSIQLLADGIRCFNTHCLAGAKANKEAIKKLTDKSLMLITSLNPHIGYDKSAEIAKKAHKEGTTLKKAALELGYLTEKQFDEYVDPEKMTRPS